LLWIWSENQQKQADRINAESVSSAYTALIVEMGLAGFGGGADKVKPDITRYLPFQSVDKDSEKYKIKQILSANAVEVFWRLRDSGKLAGYVEQAFSQNKKLYEVMKEMKHD
jgi:hypothetical protein